MDRTAKTWDELSPEQQAKVQAYHRERITSNHLQSIHGKRWVWNDAKQKVFDAVNPINEKYKKLIDSNGWGSTPEWGQYHVDIKQATYEAVKDEIEAEVLQCEKHALFVSKELQDRISRVIV